MCPVGLAGKPYHCLHLSAHSRSHNHNRAAKGMSDKGDVIYTALLEKIDTHQHVIDALVKITRKAIVESK